MDLELYATAIQKQARLVSEGTLELGLFNTVTRQLLLQVTHTHTHTHTHGHYNHGS